ncbi:unnamed protein product [Ixodes pacificus]
MQAWWDVNRRQWQLWGGSLQCGVNSSDGASRCACFRFLRGGTVKKAIEKGSSINLIRGLHVTSLHRKGGHSDLFFGRYALGSKAARMATDETSAHATRTLLRFSPVLYEHTSAFLCYTPTFDSSVFTKDAHCKNHHNKRDTNIGPML